MYSDFAVQVTWEGANQVLALQAGRALLGSFNGEFFGVGSSRPFPLFVAELTPFFHSPDGLKGKKLAPGVAFLARPGVLTAKSNGKLDLEDIDQASSVSSVLESRRLSLTSTTLLSTPFRPGLASLPTSPRRSLPTTLRG